MFVFALKKVNGFRSGTSKVVVIVLLFFQTIFLGMMMMVMMVVVMVMVMIFLKTLSSVFSILLVDTIKNTLIQSLRKMFIF